ncbi:hypothetical protein LUR56_14800 [Streptomyces sp. MT29]|nr:hypothetical protein [Streptomyces sp. MT29]
MTSPTLREEGANASYQSPPTLTVPSAGTYTPAVSAAVLLVAAGGSRLRRRTTAA